MAAPVSIVTDIARIGRKAAGLALSHFPALAFALWSIYWLGVYPATH